MTPPSADPIRRAACAVRTGKEPLLSRGRLLPRVEHQPGDVTGAHHLGVLPHIRSGRGIGPGGAGCGRHGAARSRPVAVRRSRCTRRIRVVGVVTLPVGRPAMNETSRSETTVPSGRVVPVAAEEVRARVVEEPVAGPAVSGVAACLDHAGGGRRTGRHRVRAQLLDEVVVGGRSWVPRSTTTTRGARCRGSHAGVGGPLDLVPGAGAGGWSGSKRPAPCRFPGSMHACPFR